MKKNLIKKLKILKRRKNLLILYWNDFIRYSKYAFNLTDSQSLENIISEISFYSHSIEKGLSNKELRFGFGNKALSSLMASLEKFIDEEFDTNNIRFKTGLSTIEEYINIHSNSNVDICDVITWYQNFGFSSNQILAGTHILNKNKLPIYSELNFFNLVNNRFSIREFSDKPVDSIKIKNALSMSLRSPSACNRQPWRVYLINDKIKIKKTLILQQGFKGEVPLLALVTVNQKFYGSPKERTAAYVDGGMFGMSLIYALESEGLATCALNTSFELDRDKDIRLELGIPDEEVLILFLAIGEYPDNVKIPISKRVDVEDIVAYI